MLIVHVYQFYPKNANFYIHHLASFFLGHFALGGKMIKTIAQQLVLSDEIWRVGDLDFQTHL